MVWPENSTDVDPRQDPGIYNELTATVAAVGRPILVGEVLNNPRRNVGQLWVPGRGPTAVYVKRQLVPFGEYIPFRSLISSFSSLPSLQPVDFSGHAAVVFAVGRNKAGRAVICYEVGFDNLVRSEVTAGANLLAVQSNDADFEIDGQLGETEQRQTAMARIRAGHRKRPRRGLRLDHRRGDHRAGRRADRARRLAAGDPRRAGCRCVSYRTLATGSAPGRST